MKEELMNTMIEKLETVSVHAWEVTYTQIVRESHLCGIGGLILLICVAVAYTKCIEYLEKKEVHEDFIGFTYRELKVITKIVATALVVIAAIMVVHSCLYLTNTDYYVFERLMNL